MPLQGDVYLIKNNPSTYIIYLECHEGSNNHPGVGFQVLRTGIFHVLFALFFLNTYVLYLSRSYLIKQPTLVQTIPSAHSAQQINKDAYIESHNIANATFILQRATRFKTR